jgi:hypothetical protein
VRLEGSTVEEVDVFEEAAMRIDVLVVPGCPNGPVLIERLAQALDGRDDVQVATREIDTVEQADQWGMHGSPTVLVDGRDPFAAPGTPAGVSCRLYQDEAGRAQGAPSLALLRHALEGSRSAAREGAAGESACQAPSRTDRGSHVARPPSRWISGELAPGLAPGDPRA